VPFRSMAARALAAALLRNGWELSYFSPGQDYALKKDEMALTPSEWVWKLVSGEVTADAWQEQCRALGIADLDLGDVPLKQTSGVDSDAMQERALGEL